MKEIQKIIVPVDFHQHTEKLVAYAAYFANKLDASMHLIHVVESIKTYSDYVYTTVQQFEVELVEQAEEMMKKLVEANTNTCPGCEGKIAKGDVVESIVDYARDVEGDLIVIGTHGRKGIEKLWFGSVANSVVKKSHCAILTYNPYQEN